MKVLIVAINCAPEPTGVGKYVGEMLHWLREAGHEVQVITAPPHYPAWRVWSGYSGRRYHREWLEGARVYRCPIYVPESPSGARRVLHLISFALSSAPLCLWHGVRWRPDVVFVVAPALLSAVGAWAGARLGGAKAWLHVQDFEIDAAFELGLLRSKLLRRIVTSAENFLLRRFDRVSSISRRMLDRLGRKHVIEQRRYLFPNWVDSTDIRPLDGSPRLRQELGLSGDRLVYLYSGTLGAKQGLEIIIGAARALERDARMLFLICGEGPARVPLERMASGLPNVSFVGLQPRDRLNELLNLATVHLLPQREDVEDLVLPSKLSAMMASGKPVIATAREGTELARVLRSGGVVVPPGDVHAFVLACTRLAADGALRRTLGAAGRAFAVDAWDKQEVLAAAFSPQSIAAL